MTSLELFAYVDHSDDHQFRLRIQPVPLIQYNVQKYDIKVVKNEQVIENGTLTRAGIFRTDLLHYSYNASDQEGNYHFEITPRTPECQPKGCFTTTTPNISVIPPRNEMLSIIIYIVVLVLFLALCVACCCCSKTVRDRCGCCKS